MASPTDGCCLNDPNFAVICSFINNFGDKLILPEISFEDLQESIENTKTASDLLIELHVHLLRRIGKKVTIEKWQRSIVKFCHYFDNADAWEIEQNGYEQAKISTKLKLLKNLLETQFDLNCKFREKLSDYEPQQLRCQPLGRDMNGGSYWYLIDKELNLRIYREDHPTIKEEDEVWKVICRDRDGLAGLVSVLDSEINPRAEDDFKDEIKNEEEKESLESQVKIEETKSEPSEESSNTAVCGFADVENKTTDKVGVKSEGDSSHDKNSYEVSNSEKEVKEESKVLIKSLAEDSYVKVEPPDDGSYKIAGIVAKKSELESGERKQDKNTSKEKETAKGKEISKEKETVGEKDSSKEEDSSKDKDSNKEKESDDDKKDVGKVGDKEVTKEKEGVKDKDGSGSLVANSGKKVAESSENGGEQLAKTLEKKDKGNIGNEAKAEKRKLMSTEETEVESKSRKESSESGGTSNLNSNSSSLEKTLVTINLDSEEKPINFRRESVIKIGKRVDKATAEDTDSKKSEENQEKSSETNSSKNKEESSKSKNSKELTDPKDVNETDKAKEAVPGGSSSNKKKKESASDIKATSGLSQVQKEANKSKSLLKDAKGRDQSKSSNGKDAEDCKVVSVSEGAKKDVVSKETKQKDSSKGETSCKDKKAMEASCDSKHKEDPLKVLESNQSSASSNKDVIKKPSAAKPTEESSVKSVHTKGTTESKDSAGKCKEDDKHESKMGNLSLEKSKESSKSHDISPDENDQPKDYSSKTLKKASEAKSHDKSQSSVKTDESAKKDKITDSKVTEKSNEKSNIADVKSSVGKNYSEDHINAKDDEKVNSANEKVHAKSDSVTKGVEEKSVDKKSPESQSKEKQQTKGTDEPEDLSLKNSSSLKSEKSKKNTSKSKNNKSEEFAETKAAVSATPTAGEVTDLTVLEEESSKDKSEKKKVVKRKLSPSRKEDSKKDDSAINRKEDLGDKVQESVKSTGEKKVQESASSVACDNITETYEENVSLESEANKEESEALSDKNIDDKSDGAQRVRKRKASDKLPITPCAKNERKATTEEAKDDEKNETFEPMTEKAKKEEPEKILEKSQSEAPPAKDGGNDAEDSTVRSSRRLRARKKQSYAELDIDKIKGGECIVDGGDPEDIQEVKKTRSRRRTQAELICTDLIIPGDEKRTRGKKRQNSILDEYIGAETPEEIEPKKAKSSKNFRKTSAQAARLKESEEPLSSPSDSDDMPLSKMTKSYRGRGRGRGRARNSRQPLTVLEETADAAAASTKKSSRSAKKKEFDDDEFDATSARGRHSNNGHGKLGKNVTATVTKSSGGKNGKKRSSSAESDKWVSDKTEEDEEDEDDDEEEELFVGELLRRSTRVRTLGTKNKLLCVGTSSDEEKTEETVDTSDEEFQLPKGRNARRAAARSEGVSLKGPNCDSRGSAKEAEKVEDSENDKPCCKCQQYDRPETILLCDKCDAGYHTLCLHPPLFVIPEGDWFCPPCEHKLLLEKLTTNLQDLDLQLKKRERLMKRKERLAYVGISLDNILSERKENMEPNVECQSVSGTRVCRARRSINYKFTEFDELIDSAIQDDLRTVKEEAAEEAEAECPAAAVAEEGEGSPPGGKDMSNFVQEAPVSRGKDMNTIMSVYSEGNDLRPQGIQAKKEAGRRRGKDISNLVGKGSDSDEKYPAKRKRRPKRKLTTLDSDSYGSESEEYKASEESDPSVEDADLSDYSEEEEDDDDDEDYGSRRRSTRTSTRQNTRASRKSYRRVYSRRSRRQNVDDFVVDDDYDTEDSGNYRRSTRASVKRKVNYRDKNSDEEEEMTPSESEACSADFSDLASDDSVKPNKKLKLKLEKKLKIKRVIRKKFSDDDDDEEDGGGKAGKKGNQSSSYNDSADSGDGRKSHKKVARKRRLAVSDSDSSSSSSNTLSTVRRSNRASTLKVNFKKLLDSDSEEDSGNIERKFILSKLKKNTIVSDSDSIASDDKSSIKSMSLDKTDNTENKPSGDNGDSATDNTTADLATATYTTAAKTSTTMPSTTTTTNTTSVPSETHSNTEVQRQNDDTSTVNNNNSPFSQMNGHDNQKADPKDRLSDKTETRTIPPIDQRHEDNCNNDSSNVDPTSCMGTSASRSGPQVANLLKDFKPPSIITTTTTSPTTTTTARDDLSDVSDIVSFITME